MKHPILTLFLVSLAVVAALPFIMFFTWKSRKERFNNIYSQIAVGQNIDVIKQQLTAGDFHWELETSNTLTATTDIGVGNSLVIDVKFDDNNEILSKDGFDTGFNMGPF